MSSYAYGRHTYTNNDNRDHGFSSATSSGRIGNILSTSSRINYTPWNQDFYPSPSSSSSSSSIGNKFSNNTSYVSKPYRQTQLPWSPLLASTQKYPLSKSATSAPYGTSSLSSASNSYETQQVRSEMKFLNTKQKETRRDNYDIYRNPSEKTGQQSSISSYTGHRSIFDMPTRRAPISMYTPSTSSFTNGSRYDGQIRRAITTRDKNYVPLTNHNKNRQPVITNSGSSNLTETRSAISRPLVVSSDKSLKVSESSSQQPKTTEPATNGSSKSSLGKPFRSTSLKLRNSYNNILDQLASTTFTMLKLSSGSSSKQATVKQANLDVILDEVVEVPEVVKSKIYLKPSDINYQSSVGKLNQKMKKQDSKELTLRVPSPGGSLLSSSGSCSSSANNQTGGVSPTLSSNSSNQASDLLISTIAIGSKEKNETKQDILIKESSSSGCGTSDQGEEDEQLISNELKIVRELIKGTEKKLSISSSEGNDSDGQLRERIDLDIQGIQGKKSLNPTATPMNEQRSDKFGINSNESKFIAGVVNKSKSCIISTNNPLYRPKGGVQRDNVQDEAIKFLDDVETDHDDLDLSNYDDKVSTCYMRKSLYSIA